ncbi:alpha/beta fold hydrolase [Parvibaculum sp.]|uniref:alpha/beta fold hydrolase n=1 Tax=Parvibaculum sp. TaxID=2024848 RepID=UPI0034A04CAF
MPRRSLPWFLSILLGLAACGVPAPADRKANAEALATGNMVPAYLQTQRFDLYSLSRISGSHKLLVVYIEGDGLALTRVDEISPDPTPVTPTALKLALADSAPAVAYLARPCQFTGKAHQRNCRAALWTSHRYGEEVVAATGEALDILKRQAGAQWLGLVGFSGGGAVAVLAAARRNDVAWLKTVAAPLDTDAFTHHHGVTRLAHSLNPADMAETLAGLPQLHLAGEDDKIVPSVIGKAYMARMPDARCSALRVLPGLGHHDGWEKNWARLAGETPTCR